MYAHNGNVLVSNTLIQDNAAGFGGGVYTQYGNVEISGESEISGNTADVSGAAAYVDAGKLSLYSGSIAGNTAAYGAVYVGSGTGDFKGGELRDNTGEYGGGIYTQTGTVVLSEGLHRYGQHSHSQRRRGVLQ